MARKGRVFVCHNSREKELIKPLALELLTRGGIRTWLDTWEIPGGQDWEKHLRREFAVGWSCLVLLGASGFGPFQRLEIAWARERQTVDPEYRVIPLLLPGLVEDVFPELESLLGQVHWIDLRGGWDSLESLAPVFNALRGDRPGPPVQALAVAVAAERWDQTGRSEKSQLIRGRALREAQAIAGRTDEFDELSLLYLSASASEQQRRTRLSIVALIFVVLGLAGAVYFVNGKRVEAVVAKEGESKALEGERNARRAERLALKNERSARSQAEKDRDYAQKQEAIANQQRDLAQERLDLAQSQALAADARREGSQELNLALADSAAAYEINPSLEAEIALLDTLTRAEKIKRYFLCPPKEKATGVTFSRVEGFSIAFACSFIGDTTISVAEVSGTLRLEMKVKGDGRALAFAGRDALAIGGSQDLRILDLKSHRVNNYNGHLAQISSVTSAWGNDLIFSGDVTGEVRAWKMKDSGSGQWLSRRLRGATSRAVKSLIYRADDGCLQINDYGSDAEIVKVGEEGSPIPDSTSCSTFGNELFESLCQEEHPSGLRSKSTASTIDGSLSAYSTEANEIIVEDWRSGECLGLPLFGHTHNVGALTFREDGAFLASAGAVAKADDAHGIILWDLKQRHPLAKTLLGPLVALTSRDPKLALSQDGSSWVCEGCSENLIWDGRPIIMPPQMSRPSVSISAVAVDPNAAEIAVAFSDGLVVRVTRQGRQLHFHPQRSSRSPVRSLWYANGDLYSVALSGVVARWLGGKPVDLPNIDRSSGAPNCSDVTSSGAYLSSEAKAGKNAGLLLFYDLANGLVHKVKDPLAGGTCSSLAYAGDAGVAVRVPWGYEPMYLFSVATTVGLKAWENPVRAFPSGLRTSLSQARLSSDGRRLVAVSNGDSWVLFDLPSQRLIGVIKIPGLRALTLSGDGKRLLTLGDSGLLSWNLDPDRWREVAVEVSGRNR